MPDGSDRRDLVDIESLGGERPERTELGEEHGRHGYGSRAQRRAVGGPIMLGVLVVRVRPTDRVESRGTRDR